MESNLNDQNDQNEYYYWCFICKKECIVIDNGKELQCEKCGSSFVEEIEKDNSNQSSDNPRNFIPQIPTTNTSTNTINNMNNNFISRQGNVLLSIQISNNNSNQFNQVINQVHQLFNFNPISENMQTSNTSSNNVFNDSGQSFNPFNFMNNPVLNFLNRHNNDTQFENLLNFLMMNDPNRHGTPPASKKAVESLEKIQITEDNIDKYKEIECCVCYDNFEIDNKLVKLECSHSFHKDCIENWLNMHNTCPVCRSELPTDDSDYENSKNNNRNILRNYANNNNNNNNGQI
jgi:E3 ubiquitin-protein ligase RNF115/126